MLASVAVAKMGSDWLQISYYSLGLCPLWWSGWPEQISPNHPKGHCTEKQQSRRLVLLVLFTLLILLVLVLLVALVVLVILLFNPFILILRVQCRVDPG